MRPVERLAVYKVQQQAVKLLEPLIERLERHAPATADQIDRALDSMSFNTAEGASEHKPREKARFYRIARRSGNEVLEGLCARAAKRHLTPEEIDPPYSLLNRACAMLVNLAKKFEEPNDSP